MSYSRRFFTAAEAARQIHEYASELDDVDSDIEREVSWYKFICRKLTRDKPVLKHVLIASVNHVIVVRYNP